MLICPHRGMLLIEHDGAILIKSVEENVQEGGSSSIYYTKYIRGEASLTLTTY